MRASNFVKAILLQLKSYIYLYTLIMEDLNTQLLQIATSTIEKLNRKTPELADVISKSGLWDIYSTFHKNIKEYIYFSEPHGIFHNVDHILSQKASLTR